MGEKEIFKQNKPGFILHKYINPFTDWGFKWFFKNEQHKMLLIAFLNDLFNGEKEITEITYMESDIQSEEPDGRNSVFDIICKDEKGDRYIIEMQNKHDPYMLDRLIYYTSRLYSYSGIKGVWDYKVAGIITICLANFNIYADDEVKEEYEIVNRKHPSRHIDNYKIITLHLPKVPKRLEDCDSEIKKWLNLLIKMTNMENITLQEKKEAFRKLLEVANVASLNEHDRAQYECNLKHYNVYINQLEYAEKKGIEKGMEKGEAKEKLRMARALKLEGIPAPVISKWTGLAIKQIEKL